jgi:hypothetical protein
MTHNDDKGKTPEEIAFEEYTLQATEAESKMLTLESEVADMRRATRWFNDQLTATVAPLLLKIRILEVEVASVGGIEEDIDKALTALRALMEDYSAAPTTPVDSDDASEWHEQAPAEELKSMFRDAAKKIHPDLSGDEQDRKLRTKLMSELNSAYANSDAEAIQKIVDEYNVSEDAVQGEGIGYDLVRIIRRLHKIQQHLTELEFSKSDIEHSNDWQNVIDARQCEADGSNYFKEASEKLISRIASLETQLGHGFEIDDLVVAAQRVLDRFGNNSEAV